MRPRRNSVLVALGVSLLLGLGLAAPAAAQRTVFKGQFQCDDRGDVTPLAGMAVELWRRGDTFWPVEWVGSKVAQGFTSSEGRFSFRTPEAEDNYFVRMALRDSHGVHLRDFWGINDWSVDTELRRNNVATQNYGGILFSTPGQSHKCAIWAGVHRANEDFRAVTGTELPTRGVEIQADAPGEVPFTPGTSMLWTPGFPVGYGGAGDDSITRHEYAHAMRHGLDGDFGHFVGDAATFNYAQGHVPCDHKNAGFAFNEGWAEFWAQDFWPAPDCGRPNDFETEGNVAAALTELMENCAGGQRKIMVETLRNNPMRIHTYEEFRTALGCPIPKYFPIFVIAAKSEPPPPPPPTPAVRADLIRDEASAATKLINRLGKKLKAAVRKAQDPPACTKEPCKAALKAVTLPAAIKFEIQLAKIQRSAVAPFDSKKEQGKLDKAGIQKIDKLDSTLESKQRRKIVAVSLARIKEAMKAAKPVFGEDSSKFAKGARRELSKAFGRFRLAQRKKGRALPGSLVLSPIDFKLPKRPLPLIPPPPPGPGAGTVLGARAATLTIDQCEPSVSTGKPIPVKGRLLPAAAGSPVTVTFSYAGGGAVTHVVKTDAAGNWSDEYNPGSDYGIWHIDAFFAGDANRRAASAPTCQTVYEQ